MSGFTIFSLPVAQGVLAIAPMPGRGGHYAEDVTHLCNWGPALVISLTTAAEMQAIGADRLGGDLGRKAVAWHSFPVDDFGSPSCQQGEIWREISMQALTILQDGGRVLVHCNGGCGRSGMAALRLMVEAGEPAKAALARLRGVRACAVETDAQMKWACDLNPVK